MTFSPPSASQPPLQFRDPLASDAIAFRNEICIVNRQCPSLPHIERRPSAHYFWLKKATMAGNHFASRCNMPETTLPGGVWFPFVLSDVGEKCAHFDCANIGRLAAPWSRVLSCIVVLPWDIASLERTEC